MPIEKLDASKTSISVIVFLLILACFEPANAQNTGSIEGIVLDEHSRAPLVAVNVAIQGSSRGVSSSFDGSFILSDIEPGSYTIVASLIGFETKSQEVRVRSGETTTMRFEMHEETITLDEVVAQGVRPFSAASSIALRGFDLRTRPIQSTQDLLQLAPGVVIAQHAGGGKAEQIFLRGFDADHGTDVALSIDGIPVNMISHGHGQGYADLHFIIPEIVEDMGVFKGPYFAEYGNLATAGAISFGSKEHFDENTIKLEGGSFNTGELTTIYQIPLPGQHQGAYVAGQFLNTDGPLASPQGLQRANVFGKFHTHLSPNSTLSLSTSGFSSAWDASGQIPIRAIENGSIDRFGSLDDLEGGITNRQDLNLIYEVRGADNGSLKIQSFASRYGFKLFSNFTFFLDNPVDGDMIEQTDNRRIMGLNTHYRFSESTASSVFTTTLGGGLRADDIDVSLWQSPDRIRQNELVDATINERNLFFWAQEEIVLNPMVRLQLALRGDYFTFDVNDRMEGIETTLPHASGYGQQAIVSPKANLVISPTSKLDLFANFGTGFHSNDARNVVIGNRINQIVRTMRRRGIEDSEIFGMLEEQNLDPEQFDKKTLPKAIGTELGFSTGIGENVNLSAAAWLLDLEEEYVFVGDGGFTEFSGPSRRVGIDLEGRFQIQDWLWAYADVNLSDGRFKEEPDGADSIPLAPTLTSTGGISAQHPNGLEASIRYRHIGDRPANEVGSVTAEGYTLLDAVGSYPIGPNFKVHLTIENLFDVDWNEAQFDTESRLFGEANSVSELHFTPGNPRNFRVGLSYFF